MIRHISARVDILRDGVRCGSLPFPQSSPPSVMADSDSAIKTSLAGVFLHTGEIDYLNDELQPVLIIDGVESPIGVFVPGTVTTSSKGYGTDLDRVEAYDRGVKLQQAKTETLLHWSAGTKYLDAVKQLLVSAGIGMVMETPSALTLATDREDWAIGTPYLTIINALLAEINYNDIWFDARGTAVLQPRQEPSAERIAHTYTDGTPLSVLMPDSESELDIYDAPNVFICTVSNPDLEEPMTATAVNDNPISALSTVRRRRRIPTIVQLDNIASQEELQRYAEHLAFESMLASKTVTVTTLAEPGHGVGDVVAISRPELSGIYQETGWYLTLSGGQTMSHTLRQVVLI